MGEKIKVADQSTKILNQFLNSKEGKNVLIYNDNRKMSVGEDVSELSWQELLERALEKVPSPRLQSIEAEIIRIATRKGSSGVERGKWLGLKRTTFAEKLKRVDEVTALTLMEG